MKSITKLLTLFLLFIITSLSFASSQAICEENAPICTVNIIAYGKVQHVHFREDVLKLAVQHHLTGMDKNLKDGSVHIVLQGKPQDVTTVTQLLTTNNFNSPHGHVKKLKIKPIKNHDPIPTFTIKSWTSERYCVAKPRTIVWLPNSSTFYYSKEEADVIVYQLFSPWIKCQPKYKY